METTTRSYDIYAVRTQQRIGQLRISATPTNCFFCDHALWTAERGFENRQVYAGNDFSLPLMAVVAGHSPVWPGDDRFEAMSVCTAA
jgi:hypothetical protein